MCACMDTGGDGNTITKGCLYSCQAIRTHNTLTSAYVVRTCAMETLSVCVCLELCVCVVAWCSYTQGQRCYTMFSGSPGQ